MASARKTGTNEVISTYGNATRDYTALATWEAATDNDLVTLAQSEVLECYDDAASFDDTILVADAITNASYFRIVRPAAGHGHDGTPNNGVFFSITTGNVSVFYISEDYSQVQDLIAKAVYPTGLTSNQFVCTLSDTYKAAFVGVIVFNSYLATASYQLLGFYCSPDGAVGDIALCIDCLAHNVTTVSGGNYGKGFSTYDDGINYFYNCTATNCGVGFNWSQGTNYAKNCCSSSNGTDWVGTWTKTTCTAEDATPTYVNAAGDDFHLAAADTVCRGNGTDLSADAIYPFDDDIDKQTINVWDIGFDAYSDKGKFFQMF